MRSCARVATSRTGRLTAAMTGLRMGELLALRWRDVDFATQTMRITASYTLGTPKSGLGRAVPLVDEVVQALARLGGRSAASGRTILAACGHGTAAVGGVRWGRSRRGNDRRLR